MELHQIRYFLALTRSLNFTRAAEQCHVTQPALTKAVQRLEHEMGGPLIHRERQLTQLTDLGKLVVPMLERAYAAAESARSSAEEFRRKEIAPLKIALTPCVSAAIVEGLLKETIRFIPGLQVEIVEAESDELGEMLLNGEINVAIAGDDESEMPDRVETLTLFEERLAVLVPRDSRFGSFTELPREALLDVAWLVRTRELALTMKNLARVLPKGAEPKIGHRAEQPTQLQHMVAAGLGLMLWPEHAPHLDALIARPVIGGLPRRNVRLLIVAGRRYTPALDAFVKVTRVHDWYGSFPGIDYPMTGLAAAGQRC